MGLLGFHCMGDTRQINIIGSKYLLLLKNEINRYSSQLIYRLVLFWSVKIRVGVHEVPCVFLKPSSRSYTLTVVYRHMPRV